MLNCMAATTAPVNTHFKHLKNDETTVGGWGHCPPSFKVCVCGGALAPDAPPPPRFQRLWCLVQQWSVHRRPNQSADCSAVWARTRSRHPSLHDGLVQSMTWCNQYHTAAVQRTQWTSAFADRINNNVCKVNWNYCMQHWQWWCSLLLVISSSSGHVIRDVINVSSPRSTHV